MATTRTSDRKPQTRRCPAGAAPQTPAEDNGARTDLPSHAVYVVKVEGSDALWTKIGGAWLHGDRQGFNIVLSAISTLVLSAMPLNGKLVVRRPRPSS